MCFVISKQTNMSKELQTILKELKSIKRSIRLLKDKPLNIEEASKYSGLSISTLYKLTQSNKINHYKPAGKKIYFKRSELRRYLLKGKVNSKETIEKTTNNYLLKTNKR